MSCRNSEIFNAILNLLEMRDIEFDIEIPEAITRELQSIDLKKIYSELPAIIEKKKQSTIRKLVDFFPVFENYKLSLVAVFNEILFLANEGKVHLKQIDDDIEVRILL